MGSRYLLVIVCVMGLLGGGCTALITFPNASRSGDTIALAVGSPDGMTRANTTAVFTSDVDGIPVDLTSNIRSIFNLYADKASGIYQVGSDAVSIVNSAKHEAWITIVAIDLPLGLTAGSGEVQITTTALYPAVDIHINDSPISIEILPGQGSPHDFAYKYGLQGNILLGDLSSLEAQPRAIFGPASPSSACPCPDYGAIEIKVNMPTSIGSALQQDFIRVLVDDMTLATGSARSVAYSLRNGEDLTVIITSIEGKLKFYEARFSVVPHTLLTFTGTPTIASIRYFDLNGAEVTGPVSDYNVALLQ